MKDKNKILGPIMIPGKKMLRYHEEIGFYELVVPANVIEFYRNKFHLEGRDNDIKLSHVERIESGVRLTNSFLTTEEVRKTLPAVFQDLPIGTWMIEYTFDSPELLSDFERQGLTGFSIEGTFKIKGDDGKEYIVQENFKRMNKLSDILPFDIYVYGGSTDGRGRNEHGEAHFELREKNTRKSLGKIMMPSLELWLRLDFNERVQLLSVQNGDDISSKSKKGMVRWLELNENENLIKCHKEWNEGNRYNNRATQI